MLGDAISVVALDLHGAVLHGATRSAEASKLAAPRVQRGAPLGQPVDHRHDLAAASGAVPRNSNDTIVGKAAGAS
jgi:hypothetical protein